MVSATCQPSRPRIRCRMPSERLPPPLRALLPESPPLLDAPLLPPDWLVPLPPRLAPLPPRLAPPGALAPDCGRALRCEPRLCCAGRLLRCDVALCCVVAAGADSEPELALCERLPLDIRCRISARDRLEASPSERRGELLCVLVRGCALPLVCPLMLRVLLRSALRSAVLASCRSGRLPAIRTRGPDCSERRSVRSVELEPIAGRLRSSWRCADGPELCGLRLDWCSDAPAIRSRTWLRRVHSPLARLRGRVSGVR